MRLLAVVIVEAASSRLQGDVVEKAMIIVSAISSFPRRRESSRSLLDSRLRGNDVYAVAEFMIMAVENGKEPMS